MGYYKNLEVAQAADPDRFYSWYQAHVDALDPAEMQRLVFTNQSELWARIELWESTPAPRPASEHVALMPPPRLTRRQLIAMEKAADADWIILRRFAYVAIVVLLVCVGLLVSMVA
jgi:hypothetical protein